jgi:hypothetical protein
LVKAVDKEQAPQKEEINKESAQFFLRDFRQTASYRSFKVELYEYLFSASRNTAGVNLTLACTNTSKISCRKMTLLIYYGMNLFDRPCQQF